MNELDLDNILARYRNDSNAPVHNNKTNNTLQFELEPDDFIKAQQELKAVQIQRFEHEIYRRLGIKPVDIYTKDFSKNQKESLKGNKHNLEVLSKMLEILQEGDNQDCRELSERLKKIIDS